MIAYEPPSRSCLDRWRTFAFIFLVVVPLGLASAQAERTTRHTIMEGTRYQTEYYVKPTQHEYGPKVCIIGGVHGNEVAGYLAARKLVEWPITRGTLIVLPDAHKEAIRRNVRGYPGNMNAMFPGDPNGNSMQRLAHEIWSMIQFHRPGLLVTLHESLGFYARSSSSYGYTLTHDFSILNQLFQECIDRVNPDIAEDLHKFRIKVEAHPTCPTYCAWSMLQIPATSIETCMEIDLETRVRHQLMMCMGFFDEAGLGYVPVGIAKLSTNAQGRTTDLEYWGPFLAALQNERHVGPNLALLFVRSNELEAKVFVDGYYKGCTPAPMSIRAEPDGRSIRVTVKKDGFSTWDRQITVQPQTNQTVHATLSPAVLDRADRDEDRAATDTTHLPPR